MGNPDIDKTPETNNFPDLEKGVKRPTAWGIFYLVLGIGGLGASLYTGYYDVKNIVPLFGTVIAGVLTTAISILIILYGYRMIKRDL